MKIGILIGHGKYENHYDPGAVSSGYEEFKICKEIGRYCYNHLVNNYQCEPVLVNYKADLNLKERIALCSTGKLKDCDLILELHMNSFNKPASGTEVYYYNGDSKGKSYAEAISKALSDAFKIPNRGAKPGNQFGIIRQTKPRALLVETMFISSDDLQNVKTAAGQKKAGEIISRTIATQAKLKAKTNEEPSSGLYYVQTGAFSDRKNAEAMVKELKQKGYNAIIKHE